MMVAHSSRFARESLSHLHIIQGQQRGGCSMYPRSLSMAAILLCLVLAPGHAKAQAGQTAAEPARQQPAAPQFQPSPASASDKAEPKENKKDSVLGAIAQVAPIVTATVAVLFGLLAWRFNERSIRR